MVIPLIYNYEVEGIISFMIDNKNLNKILGNIDNINRNTYLLDSSGTILNDIEIDPIVLQKIGKYTIQNLIDTIDEKNYVSQLIQGYTVYISKLSKYNLIYLSITANQTLFNKVTTVQKRMLMTIFITLIIGGFIIFLLLKANYKPIKDLKTLSNHVNKQKKDLSKNELDLIRTTIVELSQRNNELELELEQNLLIRQNFLLNQLINGNITNTENFHRESQQVHLNFKANYHRIIVVKSVSPITSIGSLLANITEENFSFRYEYMIQQLPPDIIIFIIGTDHLFHEKFPKTISKNQYQISFSTPYTELIYTPKAYIEARTNFDLQTISGSSIIDSSYVYMIENFCKKYKNKQKFIQKLLDLGETTELKNSIIEMIHELDKEKINLALIRNVYLEVILIFNAFFEQNKQIFEYPNIDLAIFFEVHEKETLKDMFLEILDDMISTINEKSDMVLPTLSIASIKKAILDNYTDCSFSIQLIAEKFDVSASYLSQYFKEKTGSTILEYMTNLKIERAKHLLQDTSIPLKKVAKQIGYIHVSSFIRRFKQVTQTTPSEYRKQFQSSHKNE